MAEREDIDLYNKCYAYLSIARMPVTPGEITRRIRLQPTEAWERGDKNWELRERDQNRWSLFSRISAMEPPGDHVVDVLEQLDAEREAVTEVLKEYGGTIYIFGYYFADADGLGLEEETVRRLAAYGVAVEFRFYNLICREREDFTE